MDRAALDRDRVQRGGTTDAAFAERDQEPTRARRRSRSARAGSAGAVPGAKVVEVRKLAAEPPGSDATVKTPAESSDSDDL